MVVTKADNRAVGVTEEDAKDRRRWRHDLLRRLLTMIGE